MHSKLIWAAGNKRAGIAARLCTLSRHLLFALYSLSGHLLFTLCSLSGHLLFTLCSLSGHLLFALCSLSRHFAVCIVQLIWAFVVHIVQLIWAFVVRIVQLIWAFVVRIVQLIWAFVVRVVQLIWAFVVRIVQLIWAFVVRIVQLIWAFVVRICMNTNKILRCFLLNARMKKVLSIALFHLSQTKHCWDSNKVRHQSIYTATKIVRIFQFHISICNWILSHPGREKRHLSGSADTQSYLWLCCSLKNTDPLIWFSVFPWFGVRF